VRGPLSPGAVGAVVADAAEAGLAAAGLGPGDVHGPLTIRLAVAADGAVEAVRPLVDRVVSAAGADTRPAVEAILDHISQLRFAAQDQPSEAWVPVMLGGTLSKVEAFLRQTPAQPAAKPASALPTVIKANFAPVAVPSAPKPDPEPASPSRGSVARASAAAAISSRLAYTRGVVRIPQTRLDAFVVPGFLTAEECAQLQGEGGNAELLERLEARLTELMGVDPSRGEPISLEEVGAAGAEAAFDFFDTEATDWPREARQGGQRSWTIMGFLDAPEEGGQIVFPNLPFKVTPAQGYLLVWNNLAADGEPNGFALHETLPVTRGTHHRFVKRYRERPPEA
jgi:prolyl 4-hydroxylase